MSRLTKFAAIALVGALALGSAGSIGGSESAQAAVAATSKLNKTKLTFSATTVDGKPYKSTALLGSKPSVIWFWAPWCAICRNESTAISAIVKKYAGKVNFLGIGSLGGQLEMQRFVSDTSTANFTHLDDSSGKLWTRFGVVIQPTVVFVAKDGIITTHVGPSSVNYLNKSVAALIAKK